MARGTDGGAGNPATNGAGVAELTYSAAGEELDTIINEFEAGVIDVDRLVERLERATEIVDELDRRLRRTRMQVEELVPRLERIGRPDRSGTDTSDEGEPAVVVEEVYIEETNVDVEFEDEVGDVDEERPPGLF